VQLYYTSFEFETVGMITFTIWTCRIALSHLPQVLFLRVVLGGKGGREGGLLVQVAPKGDIGDD
jgi:hypothetical protein